MDLTCIIFGIAFSVAGVLFACGKLHPHLSAWVHMTQEEKEQINIVPLCRNIGEMILLSGIIFCLNGLWPSFQAHWFTGAMIAWLLVAGLDVWFISKSSRYKKQQLSE